MQGDTKKTCLKAANWEAVMKAGFEKYPIGKLLEEGTIGSHVVFVAPPLGQPAHMCIYHNLMVDLCQVSLRIFTTEMQKRSQKEEVAPGADLAEGASGRGVEQMDASSGQ